jgi:hypothetical protein
MTKCGRGLKAAVLGLASLALASCGESPTAAVSQRIIPRDLYQQVTGLVSCTPLAADSVTQVIGPAGGTITVGPHSFTVPAGALDSAVSITAVAPSDVVNRIVFQPSGLVFQVPATLTMSYANCGLLVNLLPMQIAYVDDLLNILYYVPSVPDAQSQTVTGMVRHFSDYAVAW